MFLERYVFGLVMFWPRYVIGLVMFLERFTVWLRNVLRSIFKHSPKAPIKNKTNGIRAKCSNCILISVE